MSKTKSKANPKKTIDNVFRFRCAMNLIRRADAVAKRRSCDRSDIGREGFVRFLEEEENRLGLAGAK